MTLCIMMFFMVYNMITITILTIVMHIMMHNVTLHILVHGATLVRSASSRSKAA